MTLSTGPVWPVKLPDSLILDPSTAQSFVVQSLAPTANSDPDEFHDTLRDYHTHPFQPTQATEDENVASIASRSTTQQNSHSIHAPRSPSNYYLPTLTGRVVPCCRRRIFWLLLVLGCFLYCCVSCSIIFFALAKKFGVEFWGSLLFSSRVQ